MVGEWAGLWQVYYIIQKLSNMVNPLINLQFWRVYTNLQWIWGWFTWSTFSSPQKMQSFAGYLLIFHLFRKQQGLVSTYPIGWGCLLGLVFATWYPNWHAQPPRVLEHLKFFAHPSTLLQFHQIRHDLRMKTTSRWRFPCRMRFQGIYPI